MEEVAKILPAIFKKYLRQSDSDFLALLVPIWPCIVGKAIARQCRPVSYFGGRLTVGTSCPTWAAQLRLLGDELRARANKFLGTEAVKRIRILYDPAIDVVELPADDRPTGQRQGGGEEWPGGDTPLMDVAEILQRSRAKYFARHNTQVH